MSDFDSNPFADLDLNNPFKVRRWWPAGGREPSSLSRRGQSGLRGAAGIPEEGREGKGRSGPGSAACGEGCS